MPTLPRRAHPAAAFLLACVGVLCTSSAAHAATAPRLIVGFESDATTTLQSSSLQRGGVTARSARASVKAGVPRLDAVVVPAGPRGLAATRRALLAQPGVAYVEIDHVARAYGAVNDTFFSQQWALGTLGATRAWDTTRGAGVTVAVVDTGVDYVHPDLAGRVDLGSDFVDKDQDPMDVQGHGTHVAGIAAGTANDGQGIAGIAPEARILAIRVLDADGAGNYSQVASGIVQAADRGARVINLSLGGDEPSELLESAVNYAAAKGAIVVCASGNEGAKAIGYPGRYESCMSVGATDIADARAPFSNVGPGLDVTAPGAQILSSTMGGMHDSWDGTSMASPYVGGVAALLMSQGLGRRAAIDTLTATARDLGASGYDTSFGHGRIDAAAAVDATLRTTRGAADTTAPVIAGIELHPAKRTTKRSVSTAWKVTSRSKWARVGTTEDPGRYTWSKTTGKGAVRTTSTWRTSAGIVYRQDVRKKKSSKVTRTISASTPFGVTVSDDVAVDRVAFEVDGKVRAVDWNGADGWLASVPCKAGARTFVVRAYDAADNEVSGRAARTVRC
ncbi:MAG: peptidase [Thermoleophilia bacterium]|nr:peptidase [Thermoleophilia bacterium]